MNTFYGPQKKGRTDRKKGSTLISLIEFSTMMMMIFMQIVSSHRAIPDGATTNAISGQRIEAELPYYICTYVWNVLESGVLLRVSPTNWHLRQLDIWPGRQPSS